MTELTEAQILAIPVDMPERLFTGVRPAAKAQWQRLRSKWHPDTNSVNPAVMAHINALYDRAMDAIDGGTWRGMGQLMFADVRGHNFAFGYLKSEEFELGRAYIGKSVLAYYIRDEYADLVRVAQDHMERHFTFADGHLKAEHSRHLPRLQRLIQVKTGYYLVIEKNPAYLRLSDVLTHLGGKIEERHVAWILSCLYNLNCYLKLAGLVHCDISPRNVFIHPADHDAALFGGWWYARREGERLIALPPRTVQYGTPLLPDKKAIDRMNSELIKATGRELLGDTIGSRLLSMKYPKPLVHWLRSTAYLPAFEEYADWSRVLKESYGPRKFVELKLTAEDIYVAKT